MAPRGRKPIPARLRELRGNPGHRAAPTLTQVLAKLPQAPRHLSDRAKAIWRKTGPKLLEIGHVSALDEFAFAAYCEAVATYLELDEMARGEAALAHRSTGAPFASPVWEMRARARRDAVELGARFGLDPASRSRVEPAATTTPAESKFARFLPAPESEEAAG